MSETRRYPLGTYRGLSFGIERHPNGAADVYLSGRSTRRTGLSRESQGPKAVTNALVRLVNGYADGIARTRQDRDIAQTQLVDFEARLGRPFTHTAYLDQLTELRDRLKVALSGTPKEGEPGAGELAEQIKSLRGQHVVEAPAKQRKPVERPIVLAEPITEPVVETHVEPVVEPVAVKEPVPVERRPSFVARLPHKGKQMTLF